MRRTRVVLVPAVLLLAAAASGGVGHAPARPALPPVAANDNRVAAGTMKDGVLEVSLDTRQGDWRPYGPTGPAVPILAFGERGKPLQTPGPMIRVRQGTRVHVRVANSATGTLVVHGLADRHRAAMDTLVVPAGETRDASFVAADAGTFFYWGTTTGVAFGDRYFDDVQLNGALIVDPVGAPPPSDRIFVIQWYVPLKDSTGGPDLNATWLFTFNGMPWPLDERMTYAQGDSVRWRFINTTADVHPLHLHGFYFRINARGDMQRDTVYWPGQQRMAVTELMDEGTTMDLSWLASRPGAWIFHCHLNWHVIPNPPLGDAILADSVRLRELFSAPDMSEMSHMMKGGSMPSHAETGMGGLVIAINIKPSATWKPYTGPRERLRLYIQSDSQPGDTLRKFGYALATGNEMPAANAVQWPGPPIILHKGRPTSIWVINRSTEPSQVHWHGLEIDSYYDGVAGLSSNAGMVSPMIMPRDSFEVTVTPPRAGSFMYHTHINDMRQQSHGLYGPIVVLDSNETWDPAHDLIFQSGTDPTDSPILNGSTAPAPLTLHAGTPYRIRLMNISLDVPFNELWLSAPSGASLVWTAVAKDGYDLPEWQQVKMLARQRVSIGETYDFRVTFPAPGDFAMEGRSGSGRVYARQAITVVK